MNIPKVSRPHFPPGYVENPTSLLSWSQVEPRLAGAVHYWLGTVRPDGRPHAVPKWAVWVDGCIYFDGSPETRHARNIAANPFVSLHLEDGSNVVILEGTARALLRPATSLAVKVARAYTEKYAALGYSPSPDQWDRGGLFEITPRLVLAWTKFTDDPTRFEFEAGEG